MNIYKKTRNIIEQTEKTEKTVEKDKGHGICCFVKRRKKDLNR